MTFIITIKCVQNETASQVVLTVDFTVDRMCYIFCCLTIINDEIRDTWPQNVCRCN